MEGFIQADTYWITAYLTLNDIPYLGGGEGSRESAVPSRPKPATCGGQKPLGKNLKSHPSL